LTLLTALTVGLGSSIAKGIFKVWLSDSPGLEHAASSMTDLVSSVTPSVLARRKLNRKFEVVAEDVASAIHEIIENEFPNLPLARKIVVANSVNDLIAYGITDYSEIVQSSLKPENLAQELISKNGRAYGNTGENFREQEKRLYVHLVSEASQMLIDLASSLPGFSEAVNSESLKKIDDIEDICKSILDEAKKIRTISDTGSDDDRKFESDYRRSVVRSNSNIQLFGVNGSESSKRYDLNVAYVALEMDMDVQGEKFDDEVTIEEALHRSNRLVIRGAAGAGKTTLLQWLSVNMASMSFADDMHKYNSYLPFFIRVRKYPNGEMPKLLNMVSDVSEFLGESMPKGWITKKLESGNAVVMIDGLDEISPKRRESFKKWVQNLIDLYPDNKYIVTMRPL